MTTIHLPSPATNLARFLGLVLAMCLTGQSATAQTTHTLTSTGANVWTTATWTGGAPANSPGDIAQYNTASISSTTTLDTTGVVIGQLLNANSGAWTIANGAGTSLMLDNTGGASNPLGGNNAFIGTTGSGTFSVAPNISIANTNLDIGVTGTGNVGIGGSISGAGNITLKANSTGTISITGGINNTGTITNSGSGAANVTIGGIIGTNVTGLTQNTSGTLILTGANTFNGGATVSTGTLQVGDGSSSGAVGTGNVSVASGATLAFKPASVSSTFNVPGVVSGAGNLVFDNSSHAQSPVITLNNPTLSGNITFTNVGSGNPTLILADFTDQTISGAITRSVSGNAILVKTGTGTLTLSGTNGTAGFGTRINGGALVLDYGTNDTNKLSDGNGITFGGGTVTLSGGTHTEVVSGATLGSGGATTVNRSSGSATLQLNAFTVNAGGTVNFGAASIASTDTTNVSGILGGRYTVGGADWALNSTNGGDGPITALSSYASLVATGGSATTNYLQTDSLGAVGTETINSLKIATTTSGQSLSQTAATTLTVQSGGVLFTGANDYSITGASIKSGTTTDLIIQQWGTGNLTIDSVIANGTGTLTKSGTGKLTLTGTNTYTGQTYLNQGTLSISSNANLGAAATGATLNINGGTLQATQDVTLDNSGANKRAIVVNGGGATFDVASAKTLAISGVISNATNAVGSIIKTGSGSLALSGTNTFTGPTLISGGTLTANSAGALGSTSNVTVSGGTLASSISNVNLGGALTIAGGNLAANGSSTGSFTLAPNQSFFATSGTLSLSFATISAYDQIIGSGLGTFGLSGGVIDLTGSVPDYTIGTNYQIFSGFASGSVTGISFTNYDHNFVPHLSSGGVLSFTAIPEPGTYASAIPALLGVLLVCRSMRRKRA